MIEAKVMRHAAVRPVDTEAPRELFEGRSLAAYEVPTDFFMRWLKTGGRLQATVMPADARVYLVLTDEEQFPGLVQLIVESASFAPVVNGEVPCFRVEPVPPATPGRKPS